MKGKRACLIAVCLALARAGGAAESQTNSPPDIIITSESWITVSNGALIVWIGNVQVDDPGKMLLTAEYLTAHRPTTNIESIVAQTNVVIDLIDDQGQRTKARGAQAVYTASNNIIELTGKPSMENAQGSMTADLIILNRSNNYMEGKGKVETRLRASFLSGTNTPGRGAAARTNSPTPPRQR